MENSTVPVNDIFKKVSGAMKTTKSVNAFGRTQ